MLIVDEVHHLLAGTYREQRASPNLLKYLANDLQISMVLVGTRGAVLALQIDPQMVSRYTHSLPDTSVALKRADSRCKIMFRAAPCRCAAKGHPRCLPYVDHI